MPELCQQLFGDNAFSRHGEGMATTLTRAKNPGKIGHLLVHERVDFVGQVFRFPLFKGLRELRSQAGNHSQKDATRCLNDGCTFLRPKPNIMIAYPSEKRSLAGRLAIVFESSVESP